MIRVAMTGTHGVGKTYITERVAEHFRNEGLRVETVPSITRKLREYGLPINNEDPQQSWKVQILCASLRQFEEKKLPECDLLLSDRMLLDEFVYGKYFYNYGSGRNSLLKHSLHVLEEMAKEDLGKWDLSYWKRPHPDYLPEEDGHRQSDRDFQERVDLEFALFMSYSSGSWDSVPESLPLDRDEAAEQVIREIGELL